MGLLLEVIVLDVADARAAAQAGADRLELVRDMAADGLTPDLDTVAQVHAAVDLPVRVMVRLDAGFAIAPNELDRLCAQATALRSAGAREFVMGFLTAAGDLDLAALSTLAAAVAPSPWTLHRAFDRVRDPADAHRRAALLPGLDRVLSSGGHPGLAAGPAGLAARAGWQRSGPRWIAGGGLREEHLPALAAAGIGEFHCGRAVRAEGRWDRPVDPSLVTRMRAALDRCGQ